MDECSRSLRQLEMLAEPAGGHEVERALAPLVLVFGLGDQAKLPAFWSVYREALQDLPKVALDRAVAEWPKVGKFFPKPAEVRDLAKPQAEALRRAAYRCAKALEAPVESEAPRTRMAPDQFAAIMADFRRQMDGKDMLARTRNRMVRPSPCAAVDDTGMSAEMRAKLAEQRNNQR